MLPTKEIENQVDKSTGQHPLAVITSLSNVQRKQLLCLGILLISMAATWTTLINSYHENNTQKQHEAMDGSTNLMTVSGETPDTEPVFTNASKSFDNYSSSTNASNYTEDTSRPVPTELNETVGSQANRIKTAHSINTTESTTTKQHIPKSNETNTMHKGVPFDTLYVDIISMERSSSTNLLYFVLAKWSPCVVPLNEIFNAPNGEPKEGPWAMEGKDLLKFKSIQQLDPRTLQNFLRRVSQRACLAKAAASSKSCDGKCVVGYKEFYEHLTPYQHQWLWNNTPNLIPVVLERNVEDRWRSKWLALNTGDWDTKGSPEQEAKITAQHVPPVNYSNSLEVCHHKTLWRMCHFEKLHNDWYEMVRSSFPPQSRVELTFKETVTDDGKQALDKIVQAFPAPYRDLGWSTNATKQQENSTDYTELSSDISDTEPMQTVDNYTNTTQPANATQDTGQASTKPQALTGNQTNATNEAFDYDILYVDIISMQRSSSTNLLFFVLAKWNPCVVPLNEIFNAPPGDKQQKKGSPWAMEGKDLLKNKKTLDPLILQDFLWRVSQRKCLEKDLRSNHTCSGKCIVGYKEFSEHLTPYQHQWLWNHTPNLVPVILERNVEDRWKSKWLAENTGDWDIQGSDEHEAKLAAQHVPPLNYSNTLELCQNKSLTGVCHFEKLHRDWYRMARSSFPLEKRVEVTFNESVTNGGWKALHKIVHAFPVSFRDWWWSLYETNSYK